MIVRMVPVLVLLVVLLSAVRPLQAAGDEPLRSRFLREAPQGWARLSSVLLHSRGMLTLSVDTVTLEGTKPRYAEVIKFALNGSEFRRVESNDTGRVVVGCRNRKDSFHLVEVEKPTSRKKDHDYRIDELKPIDPARSWTTKTAYYDHVWRIAPLIYSPFAIDDYPLAEITISPEFHLDSVNSVGVPPSLVKIQFQYRPINEDRPWQVTAILDPQNCWAVREYRQECLLKGYNMVFDCEVAYGPHPYQETGVHLPRTATLRSNTREKFATGKYSQFDLVLKEFSMVEVPESEFQLSAFGLTKDAANHPDVGSYRYLTLILFNIGLFLLLAGLWYLRHRPSQQA